MKRDSAPVKWHSAQCSVEKGLNALFQKPLSEIDTAAFISGSTHWVVWGCVTERIYAYVCAAQMFVKVGVSTLTLGFPQS